MNKIIEISNSSFNSTNSLLSSIIIFIFISFSVAISTKIYNRIHPDDKYKDPNIFYSLIQNTMSSIQYFMGKFAEEKANKQLDEQKKQINEMKEALNKYANSSDKITSFLGNINNAIYHNFTNKLQIISTFLDNLKGMIGKVTDITNSNINNFEKVYKLYQTKLQNYVNNMVSMMRTIANQIKNATVTPGLFNIITPLTKVYNSIHDTLKNNTDFIHQFYPKFKLNPPPVDNSIKTGITSSFKVSSAVLKTSGYK